MLIPFDDYPLHQTPLPFAYAGQGHPDHYDRYWFNGYTEDLYFAVALGIYPNRGVIDAAFSVVHDGVQRSVFASGAVPTDRTRTRIGPVSIDIIEPMLVNRIRVDAPEHGLVADLTYRARTPAYEEPRQTQYRGTRLAMDVTRATQLGSWTGSIRTGGESIDLAGSTPVYGTKDRSWGVRPMGRPVDAGSAAGPGQIFFLWAPLNFEDRGLHYMVFEDENGHAWSETAVQLPILDSASMVSEGTDLTRPLNVDHTVQWAPGLRRASTASLTIRHDDVDDEAVALEPLFTFRMKGAGYSHPEWAHGSWHGDLVVGGEEATVGELDGVAPDLIHVQQVVRATWGDRVGLGVLEQLAVGPHAPSGFRGFTDGAR